MKTSHKAAFLRAAEYDMAHEAIACLEKHMAGFNQQLEQKFRASDYYDDWPNMQREERVTALEDLQFEITAVACHAELLAAATHAAKSFHHPSCKAQGEYSGQPELYCTCHVQKARAAIAKANQ